MSLEDLVTSVATELMAVTASTLQPASTDLLHRLVDYFQVDLSFLRRNDHILGATVLVAEWPPRSEIPQPDPLGVILFVGADPTFAALENLSSVLTTRPGTDGKYQDRVREGSGIQGVSLATVPLLTSQGTTGTLGFIKFGDRAWQHEEINALQAVAALLAQLQARVAAEEQLRYLAEHDELTALATRRGLTTHLTERLLRRAAGPVAVIVIDVDRLKVLNSFLGHAAGDQFLQTLAQRLTQASPEEHFLARLGGDEFVAVMTGPADEDRARTYAELLRHTVHQPVQVGGEEITRGISLGVALGTPGRSTVSELISQADQAMLQAKSHGGNGFSMFTTEMHRHNEIRTDIELHLAAAIRGDSLVLHYQPQVALLTGEITGLEALVRWPHPTLGLLPPGAFIDLVESTNLSGELGRWVIATGCRQLKAWHDQFPHHDPITLSMNISPADLITTDFVDTVHRILTRTDLDGRHVTLEITEQALVRDTEQALATLHGLKQIGVNVAIDDFGTGYSSFAQLKSLPVDELKIDREFIQNLGHNTNDLAIVRSIINLADAFDLRTVAEGIETEIAATTLIALGCQYAQGFLYAKPLPANELETMLGTREVALRHNTPTTNISSAANSPT
jgi:diguanylate cyclase (GGDEF)-like protein